MVIFRERFLAINTYRLIESYVFTQYFMMFFEDLR